MRNQITRIFSAVVLTLLALGSNAQITVEAKVDKARYGVADKISLRFIIKASDNIQQFIPPDFKDFQILGGPLHVSTLKDSAFIMEYELKPLRSGDFVLHGASVKVNNRRFAFNAVHFSVNGSFANNNTKAALDDRFADYVLESGEELSKKIRNNHFIKVDVDRTTVLEGEPVVATFKLFTRLRASSKVLRRPGFAGFSVTDMVNAANAGMTTEVIDGKVFNVYLIRKVQLYPLQPGNFTIEPVEIENEISFLDGRKISGYNEAELAGLLRLFELDIDSKDVIKQSVIISSAPVVVEVKPLPETESHFRGAVGNFTIGTRWDADKLVFTVQIEGEGNFSMINPPRIEWPSTVEVYDAGVDDNYAVNTAPLNGHKLFHYKLTGTGNAEVTIPSIPFTYFNPETNAYATIFSNALTVALPSGVKDNVADVQTHVPKSKNIWPYAVVVTLVLFASAVGWMLYKRQKKNDESVSAETTKISPTLDLTMLRKALVDNNATLFYNEMNNALHQNIKMLFDEQTYSAVQVKEILAVKKIDDKISSNYVGLLERCELFKYTRLVKDEKALEDLYREVMDVLESVKK